MEHEHEQAAIEAALYKSWDEVTAKMKELERFPYAKVMLELISELRSRGYDRKFRAGNASLMCFILSRSRQHGLRLEQHCIMFEVGVIGRMAVYYRKNEYGGSQDHFIVKPAEITPEIEALIAQLLEQPIN